MSERRVLERLESLLDRMEELIDRMERAVERLEGSRSSVVREVGGIREVSGKKWTRIEVE